MKQHTDLDELQNFLRQSGLKPKDYLGQNFLVDEEALKQIIAAAQLQRTDTVLEVGPGLGVLTRELLPLSKRVIAIEKDEKLFAVLQKELKSFPNLELVRGDILQYHLDKIIIGPYKVVANIPYYLTSKLFQVFLEQENPPECLVLMVQKEVGERVVAAPGSLSVLGISVQIFADAKIIFEVPAESFWPVPKVDSVVLQITPRQKYPEIIDQKFFFRLLKIAFAGKRKQIHNTLSHGFELSKDQVSKVLNQAGVSPTQRPQELTIEQWILLYQRLRPEELG